MTARTAASRPLLVMVTGEPGSGKTTLGLRLSDALRIPFLSRDHVRGGLLATAGLWTNQLRDAPPREAAVDAFVEVVEAATRAGITMVVEFIVTPERSEAFGRLNAAANCVVVLTVSGDAAVRADRRDRIEPLLNRSEVLAALGQPSIEDFIRGPERARVRTEMKSDFENLPHIRVVTDDGYEPSFDQIVDWIIQSTDD